MNSLIKNQAGLIRELLDSTSDIGIIIGENQNIDSVAAALGLYLILQADGKNVQVVSKKEPTVEVSNLFGINKVSKAFLGNTKILTISVPYREGEIEKVSYNIEGSKLNVNLFAEEAGISFSEQDVEYIRKGASPALIITIGVGSDAALDAYIDPKAVRTIHIDKNSLNAQVGDVNLIDPSFSSISEIVTEVVRELGFVIDHDAFQNLMDGISYATGNFTNPATSPFAFEAAGFLLQNGAKRNEKSLDRSDRNQIPREDRNRNFPRADQFLQPKADGPLAQNQQTPRVQSYNPQSNNQSVRNPQTNQPTQIPQPYKITQPSPKEMSAQDISNELADASFTEGSTPENVPDDWFLPKVFKGSKKGN